MSWPAIDETHDPSLTSWVLGADGHRDFPIQNLPFGLASRGGRGPTPCVAIGDMILDIGALFGDRDLASVFARPADERVAMRRRISRLLSDPAARAGAEPHLFPATEATLHLPFAVGDYTDFYAGIHHATNVGALFRPDNPLLPNYKFVPIGYHGRASSIRVSGEPVRRPNGQTKAPGAASPHFGPTSRLDYELEVGIWLSGGNALGEPVPVADAPSRIAGLCLLNDWSARDIQAWEYQPLGPFLAKNFHSTVSPWVVTAEALAPFRIPQPGRPDGDPAPLPYLLDADDQAGGAFALQFEVAIRTATMAQRGIAPHVTGRSSLGDLYWTIAQLVTHHASNGCNLNAGDLIGTGTISGPDRDSCGSLIEATLGGREPIELPTGELRTFLEDGDSVIITGTAQAEGRVPIGFGRCEAQVIAAP